MNEKYALSGIIAILGGKLVGEDVIITRLSSLANASEGDITFLADSKYAALLATTRASALILSSQNQHLTSLPCILTDNPYAYFAKVSELLNPAVIYSAGIYVGAIVAPTAKIPDSCTLLEGAIIGEHVVLGENVVIGAGAVIMRGSQIGDDTHLAANTVIYHDCTVGKRCKVAAGSVIGADGFGYAEQNGIWVKIPQVGRVIIHDDVEIGANTTIDRGALDDTIIEQGVKLDNLIQIGHNCRIGAHTVIAGCVGIAGSARIGKHCKIGGAAMILGHLEIADDVTISPGSMITRSLKKSDTYTALMPFQTHDDWLKTAAQIRHMDTLVNRIKSLEDQVAVLCKQSQSSPKNITE
jgi:UDP-3-O-[3-hydroxymyristoyl] glucosamine N-acyltransferase